MAHTPPPTPETDTHGERAFFAFMTIVLLGMYAWSVITSAELREPPRFILFTVLLVAHLRLHWSIFTIYDHPRWHAPYFLAQGLLALPIVYLSGNIGMIFSTYMALIGESIGLLRGRKWLQAGVVCYNVLLAILSFGIINGWDGILWSLVGVLPMTLFVIIYVTLYTRQSEAREQAQALAVELEAANRQLTEYAARVEDLSIAAERQRMARELHDTLSQGLAGLILQLEAVDAHLANNHPEKGRAIISNAMLQARATLADARRAIDDLRREPVDDLEMALRLEVTRFTDTTGIPCDFQADPIPPMRDPVRETLIRAVAEGLANTARYARARQAQVSIAVTGDTLVGIIRDDGIGFDPAAVPAGHYGLVGIRERARLVGGSLDVVSAPGQGTTLKIVTPL